MTKSQMAQRAPASSSTDLTYFSHKASGVSRESGGEVAVETAIDAFFAVEVEETRFSARLRAAASSSSVRTRCVDLRFREEEGRGEGMAEAEVMGSTD